MKSISFLCLVFVSCLIKNSHAAPSRYSLALPSPPAPATAPAPAAKPPGIFNLLGGGGLSDFARRLSSGLESVGSEISNVINDNVKGVSDAVNTALQTGGHIANSGVKLAMGIPKIPLAFLSGA